mmetsp:Transcript_22661/g.37225  ORF Transcript_22661/g.37225 Transcript_22661/m.37225 type:complete len:127 (-) Transcript_22661:4534-4914(-)
MIRCAALAFAGFASICHADDGHDLTQDWQLIALNGDRVTVSATLTFVDGDRIAGRAPCNRYSASLTATHPQFHVGPILSTKMACPNLAEESAFFAALATMTQSNTANGTLTLRNTAGATMTFTASE